MAVYEPSGFVVLALTTGTQTRLAVQPKDAGTRLKIINFMMTLASQQKLGLF